MGYHYSNLAETEIRTCKRVSCVNSFNVKRYDPKRFCSQRCAAIFNNTKRGPLGYEVRAKISSSLQGRTNKYKGKILVLRLIKKCKYCEKQFETPRWQDHIYCSTKCSIRDIGSRTTSPKAARGKSGIRSDISSEISFYSRWEANFARILNLLGIKWEFQPSTFNLKTQKYTPDFYLPEYKVYIEIKNFLSDYSFKRDQKFRRIYPEIKLILILKDDYLILQDKFAPFINNWEFS